SRALCSPSANDSQTHQSSQNQHERTRKAHPLAKRRKIEINHNAVRQRHTRRRRTRPRVAVTARIRLRDVKFIIAGASISQRIAAGHVRIVRAWTTKELDQVRIVTIAATATAA